MTLDETRAQIDSIDSQMKPLFLARMECARHVAEAKEEMGSDSVFVLERELSIIEKRASDVDPEQYDGYVAFLRHLMSVSRRFQYGLMEGLRERAVEAAVADAGVDADAAHSQVKIGFTCDKAASELNLFVNMAKLNKVAIDSMNLATENGTQKIEMTLDGNIQDANMRQLLSQIAKEAEGFRLIALV